MKESIRPTMHRRESWVEYEVLPLHQISKVCFETKGAAKRFIRDLRREFGSGVKIHRSWERGE